MSLSYFVREPVAEGSKFFELRLESYSDLFMNFTGGRTSAPILITGLLECPLQNIVVVYLAVGRESIMIFNFFNKLGLIINIFIIRN
jgi:hypothetical protein